MITSPGNSPPNMKNDMYEPTTGVALISPSAILRPVPESRSSGSE